MCVLVLAVPLFVLVWAWVCVSLCVAQPIARQASSTHSLGTTEQPERRADSACRNCIVGGELRGSRRCSHDDGRRTTCKDECDDDEQRRRRRRRRRRHRGDRGRISGTSVIRHPIRKPATTVRSARIIVVINCRQNRGTMMEYTVVQLASKARTHIIHSCQHTSSTFYDHEFMYIL